MMDSKTEETDVIICGCGPTGAMLSTLLSQYSIRHVVIEKDTEINQDPRGIALDEDGIRCLQACGIYDNIFSDIGQCETFPRKSVKANKGKAWDTSILLGGCITILADHHLCA